MLRSLGLRWPQSTPLSARTQFRARLILQLPRSHATTVTSEGPVVSETNRELQSNFLHWSAERGILRCRSHFEALLENSWYWQTSERVYNHSGQACTKNAIWEYFNPTRKQASCGHPHRIRMGKSGNLAQASCFTHGVSDSVLASVYNIQILQTSLASRAIDSMADKNTRAEVRASLLDYLDTDTIWLALSLVLLTQRT